MFSSFSRLLATRSLYASGVTRVYSYSTALSRKNERDNQIEYIKSIDGTNAQDWVTIKNNVLSMRGNMNPKNVDAVILKLLVACKKLAAASSFAHHLRTTQEEISLGSINSILCMYAAKGKENKLTAEEQTFILDTFKNLYKKYKVLDSSTCEQLLHVLCVINEWEKALKVLDDIHLSSVPSHSAYSTLIATFFRLNKKKKALELVEQSVEYKRALQDIAYEEWLKYIQRKYKDKQVIAKHLEEILKHISKNWAIISKNTANDLKLFYTSLGFDAQFAQIRKSDGQCSCCNDSLDCLTLSDEEFSTLQQSIKDKLIVGSDLLLKTTHEELKRFMDFVERFAPYDVVLDGLNICYAAPSGSHSDKLRLLDSVVDHYGKQNKKILLLGRKHMLRWHKSLMEKIMSKTCSFFTENLSQDDPFFITAAILSGPHTDIVSKDLLRGHKFILKDESLQQLFKRWQWQHQWMIFLNYRRGHVIQPPLKFTPCAQKKGSTWHLPVESEAEVSSAMVNDGVPDLRSWLCLRQKL